jgi:hypothetical protein
MEWEEDTTNNRLMGWACHCLDSKLPPCAIKAVGKNRAQGKIRIDTETDIFNPLNIALSNVLLTTLHDL